MTDKTPYVVKRDGMVHDRATGQRVGMVRLDFEEGWTGYLLGPDYPTNPWQQTKVDAGLAGRRWSVARAVWEAHAAASVTQPAENDALVERITTVLEAHQFDPAGPGLDASCHADDCGWAHPWDRPTHEMWAVHREHVAGQIACVISLVATAAPDAGDVEALIDSTEWNGWDGRHLFLPRLRKWAARRDDEVRRTVLLDLAAETHRMPADPAKAAAWIRDRAAHEVTG